jgi:hypothetical protein
MCDRRELDCLGLIYWLGGFRASPGHSHFGCLLLVYLLNCDRLMSRLGRLGLMRGRI